MVIEDAITKDDLIQSMRKDTKESFFEFVKCFWSTIIAEEPVWNWHIEIICEELQTVAQWIFDGVDKEYDLIINVPPGSTKSTVCSIMFPAWLWAVRPDKSMICGSYSHPLSLDLALRCRDIIQSDLYQELYNVPLRTDRHAVGSFKNIHKGTRFSTSVGGTVTGMHGDVLLIDDPLNPEEAASDAELKNANKWMGGTLSSRVKDKRKVPTILIMQRLHEGDPTQVMLDSDTSTRHICLPAEINKKTLKDVKPGNLIFKYKKGLLDPVRMPRKVLKEARSKLGEYEYAGQYLQRPVPPEGGKFKVENFHIEEYPPISFQQKVRYWDKAGTAGGGCYTAGVLMGEDLNGRFWVLDVIKFQKDSFERDQLIKMTAQIDGVETVIGIEQEGGSGGKQSAQESVIDLAGFIVEIDDPKGDKETRALPFSKQVNGGNVYLVKAAWNKEYISEHGLFPFSKFKDQVDASSGAFKILTFGNVVGVF